MIEKIDSLERSTAKAAPLKGKATIELRDAKTGELVYEKTEHNLVTNYFQGPFTHEICATYQNQPKNFFNVVQGVQLLNHSEEEDPSNVEMNILGTSATGYGTLSVNSTQTDTKLMSYNLLESGATPTGYKWVWDANVNQCNGPIECISLITKTFDGTYKYFDFEKMRAESTMPLFLGKWTDTVGNAAIPQLEKGKFSNIAHIDWENEWLYDIERDYDNDKRIILKKYNLNRDRIHLKYRLKPTLIEERAITFQNSLNHDYVYSSNNTYARPFSVKIEGNTLYMVKSGGTSYQSSTNLLRIIKINLSDYSYTDEVKTLTQTWIPYYMPQLDSENKSRNFHFIRDYYPIYDGYVYLCAPRNDRKIYKVSLSDVSDITTFDTTPAGTSMNVHTYMQSSSIVTSHNIIFGQYMYTSGSSAYYVCLSLKDGSVRQCLVGAGGFSAASGINGYYGTSTSYFHYELVPYLQVHDGVITMCRYTTQTSQSNYQHSGLVYLDQHACKNAMVTVNNVTPVVKTSDKTMRVIYELSEATS